MTSIHRPMRNEMLGTYLMMSQNIETLKGVPQMIRDTADKPRLQAVLISLCDTMLRTNDKLSIDWVKGFVMLAVVEAAKADGLVFDTSNEAVCTCPEAGVGHFSAPRYYDGHVEVRVQKNRKRWNAASEHGRFGIISGNRRRCERVFRDLIAFQMMKEGKLK